MLVLVEWLIFKPVEPQVFIFVQKVSVIDLTNMLQLRFRQFGEGGLGWLELAPPVHIEQSVYPCRLDPYKANRFTKVLRPQ